MGEYPVPRPPKGEASRSKQAAAAEPTVTPKQQQAIAHSRGRICKKRGCEICAPLREDRRLKKAQRKADAQAQLHAKGQPCGRTNCPEPICVRERHADVDAGASAPAAPQAADSQPDDGALLRRQAERHRAGLPCGFEHCVSQVCVEGFAQERARRHRAHRPCRSSECANPICAASR